MCISKEIFFQKPFYRMKTKYNMYLLLVMITTSNAIHLNTKDLTQKHWDQNRLLAIMNIVLTVNQKRKISRWIF